MKKDRWSQEADLKTVAPDAIEVAKKLESEGYTQHDLDELKDGEQVIAVAAHNGAHGPARYEKFGEPVDASGQREKDVIVLYPDSNFEDRITYEETLHQPIPGGKRVSRLGFFRPSAPEHQAHIVALYEARRQAHMNGGAT